jgi:hypothetical protein
MTAPKKRGRGRPKLPAKDRADRRLTIRLTREDEKRLEALREALGDDNGPASESEAVRWALEHGCKRF